jgi:type II secretory pathway component PulK
MRTVPRTRHLHTRTGSVSDGSLAYASGSCPAVSIQRIRGARAGVVLPAVLVVVVLLTLAAYEFSTLMVAEYRAVSSHQRAVQARAAADSGIHYAAALLSDPNSFANVLNSNPYNNSTYFQGIAVGQNPESRLQTRFFIVAPLQPGVSLQSTDPYYLGVIDEGGKINLNALLQVDSSGQTAYNILMNLPNMTDEIANSILDWIDADSDTRSNGAEDDYYMSLSPPYHCKNGPLDSLEELLLVKGVTPQLLFGNDTNRNGVLDAEEDDGTGQVDQGWSAYLTVSSREENIDSEGNQRIYINDSDLNGLYNKLNDALGEDMANFIIAYRLYGSSSGGASGGGGGAVAAGGGNANNRSSGAGNNSPNRTPAPTTTQTRGGSGSSSTRGASAPGAGSGGGMMNRGSASGAGAASRGGSGGGSTSGRLTKDMLNMNGPAQRISSLFQLVNARISVPVGSSSSTSRTVTVTPGGNRNTTVTRTTQQTTVTVQSPLNDPSQLRQLLPVLLDKTTTTRAAELPPRININTAPAAVLMALPGMQDADVQSILATRPDPSSADTPDPIFQTTAWLIAEANFPASRLQTLDRYITARTQVYRVQSVGMIDGGGPTARVEAIIDTNQGRPRIIYYRDLTELGRGFDFRSQQ